MVTLAFPLRAKRRCSAVIAEELGRTQETNRQRSVGPKPKVGSYPDRPANVPQINGRVQVAAGAPDLEVAVSGSERYPVVSASPSRGEG
jgi:hypothetical protein